MNFMEKGPAEKQVLFLVDLGGPNKNLMCFVGGFAVMLKIGNRKWIIYIVQEYNLDKEPATLVQQFAVTCCTTNSI